MTVADLYCVCCGQYSGEGSHLCPNCRDDAAKLADYVCRKQPAQQDPYLYDHYKHDQLTKHIHYRHLKRRR